jgi:uncharacterized protein YdeI (YjbR/CyaY-like superfamily)
MKDDHKILQQQGNVQVGRIIRFTNPEIIKNLEEILKSYVCEAIAIEESGIKPEVKKNPEPVPEELTDAFDGDPVFEAAFCALTPGRQRGYIIHFSQPKQSATRRIRIEKYKEQILKGLGINDNYSR